MEAIQEVGSAEFRAATDLREGDLILVAHTIKRIVSAPRVVLGYVHFDVDNVLGMGRGQWAIRRDVEVSVFLPARAVV